MFSAGRLWAGRYLLPSLGIENVIFILGCKTEICKFHCPCLWSPVLFKLPDFSRGSETSHRIYSHIHPNLPSGKQEEILGTSDEVGPFYSYHHGDTRLGAPYPATAPAPHTSPKCPSSVCVSSIAMPTRMGVQDEAGRGMGSVHMGKRGKNRECFPCLHACGATACGCVVTQAAAGKLKVPFPKGLETTLLHKKIGTGKEKLGLSPYLEMPAGCKYLKVAMLNQNGF